jgi:solute carrier family 35, member E1
MTANLEPRILAQRSLSPHSAVSDDPNERFPSFEDETRRASLAQITESPLETSTAIVPEYRWPARSNSGRTNRGAGHRHRRSLSEALNNFRTRPGSVSDNAHELAEALKAPVSYKLIVSAVRLVRSGL